MRLTGFEVRDTPSGHEISAIAETAGGPWHTLLYRIDTPIPGYTLDRADAFVAPALILASALEEDLVIDAPLSERLAWELPEIATILRTLVGRGGEPGIEFRGPLLYTPERAAKGVITGFSLGVDSSHTVLENYLECPPGRRPLTHLLFAFTGQRGDAREVARLSFERCQRHAERIGLPLIVLWADFDRLFDAVLGKGHPWSYFGTGTLRNACSAQLFAPVVSRFLYASGYPYSFTGVRPYEDMAICDPILLPRLSTELVECVSWGSRRTRTDKTEDIADNPIVQGWLDVCWAREMPVKPGLVNCSKCQKCLRTLLALDLLGKLENFAGQFDLETYFAQKKDFVFDVLTRPTYYGSELRDLARARGVDLFSVVGPQIYVSPTALRRWTPPGVKRPFRVLKRPVRWLTGRDL